MGVFTIRPPWTGYTKTAMPVLTGLIALNTLIILGLAVLTTINIVVANNDASEEYNYTLPNIQTAFFYCFAPLTFLIITSCEHICLWTGHLAPSWLLFSSILAFVAWTTQLILWELCISLFSSHDATPSYCPAVSHSSSETWVSLARGAPMFAVPIVLVLYLIQTTVTFTIVRKQRKYSFRTSDMRQPWRDSKLEDGVAGTELASSTRSSRSLSVGEEQRLLAQAERLEYPQGRGDRGNERRERRVGFV